MRHDRSIRSRPPAVIRPGLPLPFPLAVTLLLAAATCQGEDGDGRSNGSSPAGTPDAAAGAGGNRAGAGGAPSAVGGTGGGGAAGSGGSGGGSGGAMAGASGGGGSGGAGGGGAGGGRDGGGAADAARDAGQPDGARAPFTLSSTAFSEGGIIMRKYRCQYENVSPPLSWTAGPAGTRSYAITMRSAGSPHWALWDIPADITSLPERIERLPMPPVPAGSKQCKPNVDGSTWYGYAGACPMGGTNLRPYFFELYALRVDRLPGVTPDFSIRDVNAAIMANQVGVARLMVMASPSSP
jgi:Raf kinase inhibitor-like YbhB/YbcL family protein